jgi:GTP-binding protein HflX
MDLYAERTFDEWLEDGVKEEILRDLKDKWDQITNNNCVFVSAVEKNNIEALRGQILEKVRNQYQVRYPYRTQLY